MFFNRKDKTEIYYMKLRELHPVFEDQYKRWTEDDQNNIKFIPEKFNKQYNEFRAVKVNQ